MLEPDIGLVVRVFANGPGDLGSVPGRVIPKTQKMVLDASLLNTQHYKVRIKGKVEQSREGVAPSPTPRCSSYRKGSLRVTLVYGRQLYFLCLDVAQGRMNWTPNENRTHSCRFASLPCKPLHHQRCPSDRNSDSVVHRFNHYTKRTFPRIVRAGSVTVIMKISLGKRVV